MHIFLGKTALLLKGLLITLIAWCLSFSALARDLQVSDEQLVKVEVATLLLTQGGTPVVLLREPGSSEMIAIFIGPNEARAISDALQDTLPRRPMTHDLVNQVLINLDARLKRVLIDDLSDGAFLGFLEVELPGKDDPLLIDSRPSDALALGLRAGAGIYVGPDVLASAALLDHEALENQLVKAAGISVSEATQDLRAALDLPDQPGVLVTETQGSATDKGLQAGALIMAVNGKPPHTPMEFLELMRQTPPSQEAEIAYWLEGEELRLHLKVGFKTARPEPRQRQHDSQL
ncbi:Bifunctional DNase/RNase [Marinospirillum celere]|uniref:Bifunctional DNase/RNase n=1 Tax=Marinospirillum celere TaxID=1122252 RepID=A0A1I1EWG5_9GAMM|nr:bifunctional nuclease domain-containing protein [Marinospirillum celere]SFB91032.1 Bifunctional DNase/RNase [Marinospirillum celere]